VKLNYGFTGRFGQDAAAYARIEGFGISAWQLTLGAMGVFGDGVIVEAGMAGSLSPIGGAWAAGPHLGVGPGGRGGGLLLGGFLPVAGDRGFANVQIAPLLFPSEVCLPSGRALRAGAGIALPPALAVAGCAPADGALASGWLDDARAELASVPAFLRLAAELRAAGAPAGLRARALEAASDEQGHAAAAFALAARWAGGAFAVAPLHAAARFDRPSPEAVTQLAFEAWQDGCLGEGTAALCARRGLASVRDAQAACALARIAPDEARHAELSWDVLDWCWRAGGPAVREAIREFANDRPVAGREPVEEDAGWLSWHGRLTAADRGSARGQIDEQSAARLDRMLSSTG
jgi:hypothetical protein